MLNPLMYSVLYVSYILIKLGRKECDNPWKLILKVDSLNTLNNGINGVSLDDCFWGNSILLSN